MRGWQAVLAVVVCYRSSGLPGVLARRFSRSGLLPCVAWLGGWPGSVRVPGCYRSSHSLPLRFITLSPLLDHGITSRFISVGALTAVAACYRFEAWPRGGWGSGRPIVAHGIKPFRSIGSMRPDACGRPATELPAAGLYAGALNSWLICLCGHSYIH